MCRFMLYSLTCFAHFSLVPHTIVLFMSPYPTASGFAVPTEHTKSVENVLNRYNTETISDSGVSTTLKPWRTNHPTSRSELLLEKAKKLDKPGKIARRYLKQALSNPVAGIFSTYGGLLGVSDAAGETLFPLKHSKPELHIIVTQRLSPVLMLDSVISHWEIDKEHSYAHYLLERKQEDGITFWLATKAPSLTNSRIPVESLIIIAKPTRIFVPLGATITSDSANLLLPELYVKPRAGIMENALYTLYFLHFFSPLKPTFLNRNAGYAVKIE